MERITRDKLFVAIALSFADRSTCLRAHVGAVIVKEGRIIAHGYNGAPPGMPHCTEVGCGGGIDIGRDHQQTGDGPQITYPNGCIRAIHAEANAIAYAARVGSPLEGGHLYCTHQPCLACAKLLGSAGIAGVTYLHSYRETAGLELLEEQGIEAEQYHV